MFEILRWGLCVCVFVRVCSGSGALHSWKRMETSGMDVAPHWGDSTAAANRVCSWVRKPMHLRACDILSVKSLNIHMLRSSFTSVSPGSQLPWWLSANYWHLLLSYHSVPPWVNLSQLVPFSPRWNNFSSVYNLELPVPNSTCLTSSHSHSCVQSVICNSSIWVRTRRLWKSDRKCHYRLLSSFLHLLIYSFMYQFIQNITWALFCLLQIFNMLEPVGTEITNTESIHLKDSGSNEGNKYIRQYPNVPGV